MHGASTSAREHILLSRLAMLTKLSFLFALVTLGAGACGTSDRSEPSPSTEDVARDSGASPMPVAVGDAAGDAVVEPPPESRVGPIGLAAMSANAFENLAHLRTGEHARRDASFDRSGGNSDFTLSSNFLYVDAKGDEVYVDQQGPGCLYRIWFTQPLNGQIGFNANQTIHFYFDGEATPRISMKLSELFSGTKAPFLAPLVGNEAVSSGGFYSLLPFPFAKSLRVSVSNATQNVYYHFDYHVFDGGTPVTTWTGTEDSSAARALWSAVGEDPKSQAGVVSASSTVSIPAAGSVAILDVDGPRSIASVHLGVAGVFPVHPGPFTDAGRAFGPGGSSTFTVKIDPANEGVVLQRRLDYSIPDQQAQVFVDGALAGTWSDRGSSPAAFRDDFFPIPANLTAGKSTMTVTVVFQSSALDWNAF
ncbi:MAG: Fibronectin type domain protein, partial [Myxococcaceae bacterium]|nr:Fibronectin type domain protein [Myxococcaceae bacterium]